MRQRKAVHSNHLAEERGDDKHVLPLKRPLSSIAFMVLLISSLFATFYIVDWAHHNLPQPESLTAADAVFSEARARSHIRALSEDIGIRIVGTKNNEELAVAYLIKEIEKIEAISARRDGPLIDHTVQSASGSFTIDFLQSNVTSVYTDLTNILVRVRFSESHPPMEGEEWEASEGAKQSEARAAEAEDGEEIVEGRDALLISSHFDSSLGSPGASDALSGVGTMLEILRVLAHTDRSKFGGREVSPIIFNFNGGEEPGLQAAHGFVSSHKWAKGIGAFINLEACGAGGKEILFQTGPGNTWLARTYARAAARPHGTVIGHDLFQKLQAIPSDTDFRIYRDFGPIPGLDFAFYQNGHVYHTRLDNVDNITPGSLQHLGENLLPVVMDIIQADEMAGHHGSEELGKKSAKWKEDIVFFDVLGLFMVSYSHKTATVMYFTYAAFVLLYFFRSYGLNLNLRTRTSLQTSFFGTMFSFIFAAFGSALASLAVNHVLRSPMAWYPNHWLSVLMYATPAILSLTLFHTLFSRLLSMFSTLSPTCADSVTVSPILSVKPVTNSQANESGMFPTALPLAAAQFPTTYAVSFWGTQSFLVLTTVLLHVGHFGIAYVPFYLSLVMLCAQLVANNLTAIFGVKAHIVCVSVLSGIMTLYLSMHGVELFVPIMGRSGAHVDSDLVLSILIGVLTAIVALPLTPFLHTVKSKKRMFYLLAAVSIFALALSVHAAPYNSEVPKRIFLQNSHVRQLNGASHQDMEKVLVLAWADALPLTSALFERISSIKNSVLHNLVFGIQGATTAPSTHTDEDWFRFLKNKNFEVLDPQEHHTSASLFQSIYPFSDYLKISQIGEIATSVEQAEEFEHVAHQQPSLFRGKVHKLYEESDSEFERVRVGFGVDKEMGGCWAMLNLTVANLVQWNLTDHKPPHVTGRSPTPYYMIRHIGKKEFGFELELDNSSRNADKIRVELSVMCFEDEGEDLALKMGKEMPNWVTAFGWNTYISHWEF